MNIHIYSDILRERARGMSLHSTLLSLSRETLAALYSSTSSTYSRTAASAVLAILSDHDVALIAKLSLAQDDAGLICSEDGDLSMSMTRDDDDDHDDDDDDGAMRRSVSRLHRLAILDLVRDGDGGAPVKKKMMKKKKMMMMKIASGFRRQINAIWYSVAAVQTAERVHHVSGSVQMESDESRRLLARREIAHRMCLTWRDAMRWLMRRGPQCSAKDYGEHLRQAAAQRRTSTAADHDTAHTNNDVYAGERIYAPVLFEYAGLTRNGKLTARGYAWLMTSLDEKLWELVQAYIGITRGGGVPDDVHAKRATRIVAVILSLGRRGGGGMEMRIETAHDFSEQASRAGGDTTTSAGNNDEMDDEALAMDRSVTRNVILDLECLGLCHIVSYADENLRFVGTPLVRRLFSKEADKEDEDAMRMRMALDDEDNDDDEREASELETAVEEILNGGRIVVETNFRMYGYVREEAAADILANFSAPEYALPDLYVGRITQRSIQRCVRRGADLECIIGFLRARGGARGVPANVVEQMRLWARESARLTTQEAVLYDNLDTSSKDIVLRLAKENGALLWQSSGSGGASGSAVVKTETHAPIIEALKNRALQRPS